MQDQDNCETQEDRSADDHGFLCVPLGWLLSAASTVVSSVAISVVRRRRRRSNRAITSAVAVAPSVPSNVDGLSSSSISPQAVDVQSWTLRRKSVRLQQSEHQTFGAVMQIDCVETTFKKVQFIASLKPWTFPAGCGSVPLIWRVVKSIMLQPKRVYGESCAWDRKRRPGRTSARSKTEPAESVGHVARLVERATVGRCGGAEGFEGSEVDWKHPTGQSGLAAVSWIVWKLEDSPIWLVEVFFERAVNQVRICCPGFCRCRHNYNYKF